MGAHMIADDADRRCDVHVWNDEGDVVKAFWDVTLDEADDIEEQYRDEPELTVVISQRII